MFGAATRAPAVPDRLSSKQQAICCCYYSCFCSDRARPDVVLPATCAAPSVLCHACCSAANGMQQKLYNWNTLNNKVLKKLGMQLTKQHMSDIANVAPGAIERALKLLKIRLAGCTEESLAAGSPLR